MMQGRLIIVARVALAVGFAAGFSLRPAFEPAAPTAGPANVAAVLAAPRSTQYFAAKLDEAREIVIGCRDGTVRGDECTNAKQAIATVESRERTKAFLGGRPR